MVLIKLQILALLLPVSPLPSISFHLTNSSSNYCQQLSNLEILGEPAREPEPVYEAVMHFDGRPTGVLVDNLGAPKEFKYQSGNPVSDPSQNFFVRHFVEISVKY